MRWTLLLLANLARCSVYDASDLADATPPPACAPLDAGKLCHEGWNTYNFVICDDGARPDNDACVQDDTPTSHVWCCP